MRRVNHSLFNVFETVGFFADVLDLLDFNMPPSQQADGLLGTSVAFSICAFRFRMELVPPSLPFLKFLYIC